MSKLRVNFEPYTSQGRIYIASQKIRVLLKYRRKFLNDFIKEMSLPLDIVILFLCVLKSIDVPVIAALATRPRRFLLLLSIFAKIHGLQIATPSSYCVHAIDQWRKSWGAGRDCPLQCFDGGQQCWVPPKFKIVRESAESCFVRSHKECITYYNFEAPSHYPINHGKWESDINR